MDEEQKVTEPTEPVTASTENISSRRLSARARRPPPPDQPPVEVQKRKKVVVARKKTSTTPVDSQVGSPATALPVVKRKKMSLVSADRPPVAAKKIKLAPQVAEPAVYVFQEFADLPPVDMLAAFAEIQDPVQQKKDKKPKLPIRADVPPISGLPKYSNVRIPRPMKIGSEDAAEGAVIEEPLEAVEVCAVDELILESCAPPIDLSAASDLVASPVAKPAVVKKPTAMDLFLKTQPSVFSFAKNVEPPTGSDCHPSSGCSSRVASPQKETFACAPNIEAYVARWKQLRARKCGTQNILFFQRTDNGAKTYLTFSEIAGARRATVYAGDNPASRIRTTRVRPVYIAIHDRERPPVKLLLTHKSVAVSGRRPLAVDPLVDYDRDSDEEWAEEHDGEDLNSVNDSDSEEEELEVDNKLNGGSHSLGEDLLDSADAESEADSFLVSDGHFSDDEALSEDEAMVVRKRRTEMAIDSDGKTTLQLIAFSPADLESGHVGSFQNKTSDKWMDTILTEAKVTVYYPEYYFRIPEEVAAKSKKASKVNKTIVTPGRPERPPKPVIDWTQTRPEIAKYVHAKSANIDSLAAELKSIFPYLSSSSIKAEIRATASWTKKPDLLSRIAWFVKPELFLELALSDSEMNELVLERKNTGKSITSNTSGLLFKPVVSEEDRAAIHN